MEASRRLGFRARTPHTVLGLIREGRLHAYKINARVIRIRESEIQRFLDDSFTSTTSSRRRE